jgi:predicted nucleic acid-binding protein
VILADTSVWVDHFRHGNATLAALLVDGQVATHPFVIGELACGQLHARRRILSLLAGLPAVPGPSHEEALHFVDTHRLHGTGLGWVDVHLLAASVLAGVPLWTLDRRLAKAQARIGRR